MTTGALDVVRDDVRPACLADLPAGRPVPLP